MNRLFCAVALLLTHAACSSNGGNFVSTGDASTADDTATATGDVPVTSDRAATTDRAPTTDRAGTADATSNEFGRCGMTTVQALCACGMDQACQGRTLTANMTCIQCYGTAINTCCPDEAMTVGTCAQAMMCQDDACISRMCPMQYNALQMCFARQQQGDETCQNALGACFGSFPFACN